MLRQIKRPGLITCTASLNVHAAFDLYMNEAGTGISTSSTNRGHIAHTVV